MIADIPYLRHGDVALYQTDENPPEGSVLVESGVVATGSTDGGDHQVVGGQVWRRPDGRFHVVAGEGALLTHRLRHVSLPLRLDTYVTGRIVVATDAGAMPVED